MAKDERGGFIDSVRVFLKAGNGGDGACSFRREKFVPKGGPDGGNGGNGASVFFRAEKNLTTLLELSRNPHIRANAGESGKGGKKDGKNAEDLFISVPCGAVIKENGRTLADLSGEGDIYLAIKGGKGGRGNYSFKSALQTAPKISEKGGRGEEKTLDIELKIIADAGLVGFPNAGKSTFLSRVSNARPKIADYPFTTLHPSIGIVYHKGKSFSVADIPGIIQDAHLGKGLGHEFLRHIERAKIIIHLIDPNGFDGIEPVKSAAVIAKELASFSKLLSLKPRLILVNKSDTTGAREIFEKIRKKYGKKHKVFFGSAVTGEGIGKVLDETIRELAVVPEDKPAAKEAPGQVIRKIEPAFIVSHAEDGIVCVDGKRIEKYLNRTNFNQSQAIDRLGKLLKIIGLDKALKKEGVGEGEIVRVNGRDFQWSYNLSSKPARMLPRRRR